MIENRSSILKLPEQQRAQHTLAIYISKASAILTQFLVEQDLKQEQNFGKLAKILFSIKQEMAKEIQYKHSLDKLCAHVGSNHSTQKNFLTEIILEALSAKVNAQKITTAKHVVFITPSVIPDLFTVRVQSVDSEVDHTRQNCYLIGPKNLPAEYQHALDLTGPHI